MQMGHPRLSEQAKRILAACTDEFRPSKEIAEEAGMAGTGLTAWVGAYDREKRAQWRGTARADSYWALEDISDQGDAFTASLVDLGYVEFEKQGRSVAIRITEKGKEALVANGITVNDQSTRTDSGSVSVDTARAVIHEAAKRVWRRGTKSCSFDDILDEAEAIAEQEKVPWSEDFKAECRRILAEGNLTL